VSPKESSKSRKPPGPLASSAAERIATIIDAAEKAASAVIDDAEAEARRCLDEAHAEADRIVSERLTALADATESLAEQAEEIRRRSERLLALLEATPDAGGANGAEPPRAPHLSAVATVAEPAPEPDRGSSAGARLLATQMAVSGSSREEIAIRLRTGFEIEDTAPILDAILGPEE
jgi:vacuolar-type H+-ATPase subunit H